MELDTSPQADALAPPLVGFHTHRDCRWLDTPPPECDVLRDYQRIGLRLIANEMHAGYARIIRQLATGAGKTHEIGAVTLCAERAGYSVLILATRTRLVRQLHERLEAFGVQHGVIAAPLPHLTNRNARVQIASVDTLHRRAIVDGKLPLPYASVVIFDETHLALGDSRMRLLNEYPHAWLLGFTATPAKISGRPLGAQFTRMVAGPSMRSLIASGVLVPPRIFNVPVIEADELAAVPKDNAGDYATGALAGVMSQPKLTGDVVANWLRLASGKRTILFSVNQAHGAQLVQDFLRAGVPAEQITDSDDDPTREAAIARLERGETLVLVNCFLLSYGVDIPSVECISLARPTRSIVLYLQAIGRGMRPAPGKDSLIVLDHGRVVENLGLPTDDFAWSLKAGTNVNRTAEARRRESPAEQSARTCPECSYLWLVSQEGQSCKNCGWKPAPREKPIGTTNHELVELDANRKAVKVSEEQVQRFYREAAGWYAKRWPDRWRAKPNGGSWWAWMQTAERFKLKGSKPSAYWQLSALPPSDMTDGWLKSRQIRYARGKAKARAA